MPANFVDGYFFEEPAWHGLGTVSNVRVSAAEALELGNGDYTVTKQPTFIQGEDEKFTRVPDRYELVRGPIPNNPEYGQTDYLGTVGDSYTIVQNRELAEILDQGLTEEFPVETFGVLGNGERSFFVLDMGETYLANQDDELHRRYAFIANQWGGSGGNAGAIRWWATNVRVVCMNTWIAAEEDGFLEAAISHRMNPHMALKFEAQFRTELMKQQRLLEEQFVTMMNTPIEHDDFNQFLLKVFPDPSIPRRVKQAEQARSMGMVGEIAEYMYDKADERASQYDADKKRAEEMRIAVADLFMQFNTDHPYAADSVYALAQSANYAVNHFKGRGSEERIATSLLFKTRAAQLRKIHKESVKLI